MVDRQSYIDPNRMDSSTWRIGHLQPEQNRTISQMDEVARAVYIKAHHLVVYPFSRASLTRYTPNLRDTSDLAFASFIYAMKRNKSFDQMDRVAGAAIQDLQINATRISEIEKTRLFISGVETFMLLLQVDMASNEAQRRGIRYKKEGRFRNAFVTHELFNAIMPFLTTKEQERLAKILVSR